MGEVKFYPDRQKIKVRNQSDQELFDADSNHFSAAYAVLALDETAEDMRFIIFAELPARDDWQ